MDDNITTVHVTKPLTTIMIVDLMEEYPNLKEITCATSVYNRTASKYIEALRGTGIEVVIKYKSGAKSQTNGAEKEVKKLSDEGMKPREIAEKLGITLNRVYYLLRISKTNFDNRKRKHDHDEVRRLRDEGLSPRSIAEELNISIRTVYYILNNK